MTLARKSLISMFIIFIFLTMVRIHLPLEKKFFSTLYRPIDSYLSFFSLYQDWMMFAPDPGRLNVTIDAQVEFDDGSIESFSFPDSKKLSLNEKYMYGEKFRKIMSEGIRKEENSYLWKDTAKFVLRNLKNQNFEKIPLRVHLERSWDEIPDVSDSFRKHADIFPKNNKFRFYTFEVGI